MDLKIVRVDREPMIIEVGSDAKISTISDDVCGPNANTRIIFGGKTFFGDDPTFLADIGICAEAGIELIEKEPMPDFTCLGPRQMHQAEGVWRLFNQAEMMRLPNVVEAQRLLGLNLNSCANIIRVVLRNHLCHHEGHKGCEQEFEYIIHHHVDTELALRAFTPTAKTFKKMNMLMGDARLLASVEAARVDAEVDAILQASADEDTPADQITVAAKDAGEAAEKAVQSRQHDEFRKLLHFCIKELQTGKASL